VPRLPRLSRPISVSLFSAAISSLVIMARSPYFAGRSSGVVFAFDQVPCRSGSPHGVRHFLAAGFAADEAGFAAPWATLCPAL